MSGKYIMSYCTSPLEVSLSIYPQISAIKIKIEPILKGEVFDLFG